MRKLLLYILLLSLWSCYQWDNPVDRQAYHFQGYQSVEDLSQIAPESQELLEPNRALLVAHYCENAQGYQFQWSQNQETIDEGTILDSLENLLEVADQSWDWQNPPYWRVRGLDSQGNPGPWSNVVQHYSIVTEGLAPLGSQAVFKVAQPQLLTVSDLSGQGFQWRVSGMEDSPVATSPWYWLSPETAESSYQWQFRYSDHYYSLWSPENQLLYHGNPFRQVPLLEPGTPMTFNMGRGNEDQDTQDHEVTLNIGLAVAEKEVSNSLFCLVINHFLQTEDTVLRLDDHLYYQDQKILALSDLTIGVQEGIIPQDGLLQPVLGKEEHPVVGISWFGALVFTELLNQLEDWDSLIDLQSLEPNLKGTGFRLPTEAEWEFLASNGGTTLYPWGDEYSEDHCNGFGTLDPYYSFETETTPRGFYDGTIQEGYQTQLGHSAQNIQDLAGNVWEWTMDSYSSFPNRSNQNSLEWNELSENRVIRGGSWRESQEDIFNVSYRSYANSESFSDHIGLRVVFQYGKVE